MRIILILIVTLLALLGKTDSSDNKYRIAALMDSKRFFNRLLENPEFSDILANENT